jgi:hypothetical protein
MTEDCKKGNHPLIDIYEDYCGGDMYSNVVRWCPECGAIVIDVDSDGRTHPGQIMKMKIPKNSLT